MRSIVCDLILKWMEQKFVCVPVSWCACFVVLRDPLWVRTYFASFAVCTCLGQTHLSPGSCKLNVHSLSRATFCMRHYYLTWPPAHLQRWTAFRSAAEARLTTFYIAIQKLSFPFHLAVDKTQHRGQKRIQITNSWWKEINKEENIWRTRKM